ncbi:MAG: sigma-70 family RNA polymerase sigma factor [Polyangiaceae bacterium]
MANRDLRLREAVRLHMDLVWRVLRRGGLAPADAEDASQDVFWILAQRFEDVPERAQRAFLATTAMYVAADRRRSKWHRAVSTGIELDDRESAALGADEQLELRRAVLLLDQALATLDEEDRAVYILSELEQLSRSEVAESLTIPKGTVASRLRRARDAFALAIRRLRRPGSHP